MAQDDSQMIAQVSTIYIIDIYINKIKIDTTGNIGAPFQPNKITWCDVMVYHIQSEITDDFNVNDGRFG